MKKYKIIASSVTGCRNKLMKEGGIYPEIDFNQDHISDLISLGAIKEYTLIEKKITSQDLIANPVLADEGKKAGDTITVEQ